MQLQDLVHDLVSVLSVTAGPLLLTAVAGVFGFIYRRLIWRRYSRAPHRPPKPGRSGQRLSARKVDDVPPLKKGSSAANVRRGAEHINIRVHGAHIGAWTVYAAIVSSLMVLFAASKLELSVKVGIGCAFAIPQLVILFWAIDWPIGREALFFGLYLVAGVVLLRLFVPWHDVGRMLPKLITIAIIPIPGILILFYRRNQPFLILLIAAVLYFLGSGAVLDRVLHGVTMEKIAQSGGGAWSVALGLGNVVIGFAVAWLLLRQRRRALLVIAIVAGVVAAVLLDRDIAQANLPTAVAVACFIAVAVIQPLILWLMFKVFVWLADRRFLTAELVQVHLCWAFLTFYFVVTTLALNPMYRDRIAVRWGVIAALIALIAILHTLLVWVYLQCPPLAQKRLLLLRAFGRAYQREDLLDDLNDTWRRVGDVVLFAASDVASRTLESHMLETFLLRPKTDPFLRTESSIETRIQQFRSSIEGDARYPVNSVFCHDSIWWTAFIRLVDLPDVILMDLRGFTMANEGCVRELRYLLGHSLRRLVFIVDSHSDLLAIEEMADAAGVTERLNILDFSKRSRDAQRALFDLLLDAAYA
jgi:hypothetical protein